MAVHTEYLLSEEIENINSYTYTTFLSAFKAWFESKKEFDCFDLYFDTASNYLYIRHKQQVPRFSEMSSISHPGAYISMQCSSSLGVKVKLFCMEGAYIEKQFNQLKIVFSRNDYNECMLTVVSVMDNTMMSMIYAETTTGAFQCVSPKKNTSTTRNISYGGNSLSTLSLMGINTNINDGNKYLIPLYNSYVLFKRVYACVNLPQSTNVIYEIGTKKFVEMTEQDYQGVALLYEE